MSGTQAQPPQGLWEGRWVGVVVGTIAGSDPRRELTNHRAPDGAGA